MRKIILIDISSKYTKRKKKSYSRRSLKTTNFFFYLYKYNKKITLIDDYTHFWLFNRDEVLTKNKFLEEEAKRKAEQVDNGEEFSAPILQQDAPSAPTSTEDSQQDDDGFYDSDANQDEEEWVKNLRRGIRYLSLQ